MKSPRTSAWMDLWIVLAVALAVRLTYFFINSRANPSFDYLIMDSLYIDSWAKAIAAGDAGRAVYFRGPLVPYLFALVHKLGGGVVGIVLINHLAGAITSALVWRLARDYFSRTVALLAGLFAALYWPFIYFEGEVLIEPVYIALVVLSLWRIGRALQQPTFAKLVIAGACLGLAALARPTILVLIPVIPFAFAARAERATGGGGKGGWRRPSLVVVAACLVVLLPATIRNYAVGRAIVPVTWAGGLNFYIGNNPESDGRSALIPGATTAWMGGEEEALAIASQQVGDSLSAAEASRFYTARGLDFITTQPAAAARLLAKKLYMFWEGPERSNEKYLYFFWDRFGLGRVPMPGFWLVTPFALVGMVRLWPRRRELALLYWFVLAYAIGVVVFFVVARYRLPVVPVLIVFGAYALVEAAAALRKRRWQQVAPVLALVALAFAAVNASYPDFLRRRPAHVAISHYTLAGAYTERGNADAALVELLHARAAFEQAPSRYYARVAQDIYFKLGTALYERGQCDEAIKALGQVHPSDARAYPARFMFAECCEKTGRFQEAGQAYEQALTVEPENTRALEGYIRCLEKVGRWDDAAEARKRLPKQ